MSKIRSVNWVNTPVLMEAIIRYKEKRLSKSMRLWIEKLLDINPKIKKVPRELDQRVPRHARRMG